MTLDEALSQAVEGARVTAPHLQPGCYVAHSLSRGFLRCWRVDTPDLEPERTQCDFIADANDVAEEWRVLPHEEQYPAKPKLTGGWGKPLPQAGTGVFAASPSVKHPVADVIDLSAPPRLSADRLVQSPWGLHLKPLDPRKGGW